MARKRSNLVLGNRAVRQSTAGAQCDGVTRRGGRCRRKISALTSSQSSIGTNSLKYCKIHFRIHLNSLAPRPVRQSSRWYKGLSCRSASLACSESLSAQIPSHVGAHACRLICRALVKGPSTSDNKGSIYGYLMHGMCSFVHYSCVGNVCQTRPGPTSCASK